MDLKGYDHVYKCAPDLWFNSSKEVVVSLKCAPKKDFDVQQELDTTCDLEGRRKGGHKFIARFVKGIEGLSVDGVEVTNFDQLLETGPSDLYTWIYAAVLSQDRLNKAELKN